MAVLDDKGRNAKPPPPDTFKPARAKSSKSKSKSKSGGKSNPAAGPGRPGVPRHVPTSGSGTNWEKVLFGGAGVAHGGAGNFWASPGGTGRGGAHTGVDFGAPSGTKIYAPMGGVVVQSGWNVDGAFGRTVMIRLNDGNYLMFAHLSENAAKVGARIDSGQYVGRVGSTGTRSSGPHLHLELRTKASKGHFGNRESWRFADPVKYLNSNGTSTGKPHGESPGESGGTAPGGGGGGGGGSSSGGDGGGGGGGSGSYGYSKKEMLQYLDSMFGSVKILKQLDDQLIKDGQGKSIDWLIDTLVKKRITDPTIAATYMAQTGFFKKYSIEIANRLVQEKARPGVAQGSITETQKKIESVMNAEGAHLPAAELAKLARDAWVYGWNDEQIADKIASSKGTTLSGGAWDSAVADLAQYADDYGVSFSEAMHNQFKQDYLSNRGSGDIQRQLRDQAASRYSVFADDINAGKSLRSLTDGYFQQAAQLLEVDPDTLEWDDPLFANGRAFTTTGADGKQAVRSMADFNSMIKQDNRWMNTTNAKDTLSSGVYNLMQRMGLAG